MNPTITDLKLVTEVTTGLLTDLKNRGKAPELQITTMKDLTRKIWGIHKQKLLLIGARTSNGKSALAISLAHNLASQGKRIMFLSLEMPKERVLERMFCLQSKVDNISLLTGKYNEDIVIRQKYAEFRTMVSNWKLYIADCIGRDWAWLDKNIFQNMTDKPDAVFIDHIQEIRGGGSQKDAIDEYIGKMRECAIRHNFALVLCSQINRISMSDKEGNREPQLHHLKSTGYLEEAADQALLLHWPYHYAKDDASIDKEEFIINVAKNRDGMTGYIRMRYRPEFCQFTDWDTKEAVTDAKTVNWEE